MKHVKLYEQYLAEKLNAKDLSQKVMKQLDSFGQLHSQYQPKEVLSTIQDVLKKYKSFYGGKLIQKVTLEIRNALLDTGNLAQDAYRHFNDVDHIIAGALNESFVNEAKVTKKDFDAVVKVLKKSKCPITVMLISKWNEIEIIVGWNAPDKIAEDVMDRLEDAKLYNRDIVVAGDSSNYSRREYDAIEKINGGHKSY